MESWFSMRSINFPGRTRHVPCWKDWFFLFPVVKSGCSVCGKLCCCFPRAYSLHIIPIKLPGKISILALMSGRLLPALIVGWGIVFLLQPPITHHVLLGILAVLIFFDSSKPIRMMIVIVLASAWEGLGRINWFLMPALVASTLYFLEVPLMGKNYTDISSNLSFGA